MIHFLSFYFGVGVTKNVSYIYNSCLGGSHFLKYDKNRHEQPEQHAEMRLGCLEAKISRTNVKLERIWFVFNFADPVSLKIK